jgi:hypothetical protein
MALKTFIALSLLEKMLTIIAQKILFAISRLLLIQRSTPFLLGDVAVHPLAFEADDQWLTSLFH